MKTRLGTVLLLVLFSCKESETQFTHVAEVRVARKSATIQRYADSTEEIFKSGEFFFRVFDQSFTSLIADLPQAGEVPREKVPYSGHWYPEVDGGTNKRFGSNRTVLQKYDVAFHGGEDKAHNWERDHHTVSANDANKSWAGHCNGFAASAQRHAEPRKSVSRNGVTFNPYEIKALLAEIYMSAKYFFLGGSRCEERQIASNPNQRERPDVMGICEDINPGTLHVSIGNWLGKRSHALIMDQSTAYQVWNYPLYKYKVERLREIGEAEAIRLITGRNAGDYVFNPNAVSFYDVRTILTYANAVDRVERVDGYAFGSGQRQPLTEARVMDLTYVLEVNQSGEVIGGEWTGNSQKVHPDFLWVALEPVQGNGTRFFGNPHVSVDEVISMWAESAGFDPKNPPLDILEPDSVEDWGRFPNFEVLIDGNNRGAVFAGKKIVMRIKRHNLLASGQVELHLSLNGKEVTRLNRHETRR